MALSSLAIITSAAVALLLSSTKLSVLEGLRRLRSDRARTKRLERQYPESNKPGTNSLASRISNPWGVIPAFIGAGFAISLHNIGLAAGIFLATLAGTSVTTRLYLEGRWHKAIRDPTGTASMRFLGIIVTLAVANTVITGLLEQINETTSPLLFMLMVFTYIAYWIIAERLHLRSSERIIRAWWPKKIKRHHKTLDEREKYMKTLSKAHELTPSDHV